MARFIAIVSTLCLICLLIGIVVYLRVSRERSVSVTLDSAAVIKEIRPLNELAEVRQQTDHLRFFRWFDKAKPRRINRAF
jgi:hypothetical protein